MAHNPSIRIVNGGFEICSLKGLTYNDLSRLIEASRKDKTDPPAAPESPPKKSLRGRPVKRTIKAEQNERPAKRANTSESDDDVVVSNVPALRVKPEHIICVKRGKLTKTVYTVVLDGIRYVTIRPLLQFVKGRVRDVIPNTLSHFQIRSSEIQTIPESEVHDLYDEGLLNEEAYRKVFKILNRAPPTKETSQIEGVGTIKRDGRWYIDVHATLTALDLNRSAEMLQIVVDRSGIIEHDGKIWADSDRMASILQGEGGIFIEELQYLDQN